MPYDPAIIDSLAGRPGAVDQAQQHRAQMRQRGLADMYAQSQPASQPQAAQGPSKLAMRRQQLMQQGLSAQDSLVQMSKEGLVDPRLVQRMLGVAGSVPQ